MKKLLTILSAVLILLCFFGCAEKEAKKNDDSLDAKNEQNTDYSDKSWAKIPAYPEGYPTEEDMENVYKAACDAFGWITLTAAPPVDMKDEYVVDGLAYYRVKSDFLNSLDDLKLYYLTMFDESTAEELMDINEETSRFVEKPDGGLFCMKFYYKPQGFSEEETFELVKNSEDSCTYNVSYYTVDKDGNKLKDKMESFRYEKVDGRWIFTNFRVYRQN